MNTQESQQTLLALELRLHALETKINQSHMSAQTMSNPYAFSSSGQNLQQSAMNFPRQPQKTHQSMGPSCTSEFRQFVGMDKRNAGTASKSQTDSMSSQSSDRYKMVSQQSQNERIKSFR